MQIYVKTSNGVFNTVVVEASDTIAMVQAKIKVIEGGGEHTALWI
jgi:hypothetical protein